jgi:hypothetical protein
MQGKSCVLVFGGFVLLVFFFFLARVLGACEGEMVEGSTSLKNSQMTE